MHVFYSYPNENYASAKLFDTLSIENLTRTVPRSVPKRVTFARNYRDFAWESLNLSRVSLGTFARNYWDFAWESLRTVSWTEVPEFSGESSQRNSAQIQIFPSEVPVISGESSKRNSAQIQRSPSEAIGTQKGYLLGNLFGHQRRQTGIR